MTTDTYPTNCTQEDCKGKLEVFKGWAQLSPILQVTIKIEVHEIYMEEDACLAQPWSMVVFRVSQR